ncbi:hypothetical protein DCS_08233 [Drechmeria coniospora]|uniref:Uncharacterized protein n=1 Tax=Drechmeria coniospora TaxID=98403 RepID=A0A151GGN3_DRECN|nr:hypothetical protein DCS_08233 [Drechmeria coniospora]KYK56263.1 hypothetical protein DCS_08233 [Drechmeria coniospora]
MGRILAEGDAEPNVWTIEVGCEDFSNILDEKFGLRNVYARRAVGDAASFELIDEASDGRVLVEEISILLKGPKRFRPGIRR